MGRLVQDQAQHHEVPRQARRLRALVILFSVACSCLHFAPSETSPNLHSTTSTAVPFVGDVPSRRRRSHLVLFSCFLSCPKHRTLSDSTTVSQFQKLIQPFTVPAHPTTISFVTPAKIGGGKMSTTGRSSSPISLLTFKPHVSAPSLSPS